MGFPAGSEGEESTCNAGDPVNPWVRKTPWRREWLPTPVFLPGESHGPEEPGAGYSPWGRKELDRTERLKITYLSLW